VLIVSPDKLYSKVRSWEDRESKKRKIIENGFQDRLRMHVAFSS
jgi:hypothetical protein